MTGQKTHGAEGSTDIQSTYNKNSHLHPPSQSALMLTCYMMIIHCIIFLIGAKAVLIPRKSLPNCPSHKRKRKEKKEEKLGAIN